MPEGTEPRGASELPPEQVPATEQVPQPPEGGAVGPETPPADIGQEERPLPTAEELAADTLMGIPEDQREVFAPYALKMANESLEKSGRVWQSRFTPKLQEVAEMKRDLEATQARLDERRQMPSAQPAPAQPGQDPMAYLQGEYDKAVEEGNIPLAIRAQSAMMVLPAYAQNDELKRELQAIKTDLATGRQKQAERGLESDPRWPQCGDRAREIYQEYGGNVPMDRCLDMASASGLRAENAALRTGQREEAVTHVKQRAANVVPGSAVSGGEVGLPPQTEPKSISEAVDQAMNDLPGDDHAKIVATGPPRTRVAVSSGEATNPAATDREGILARLMNRGQT